MREVGDVMSNTGRPTLIVMRLANMSRVHPRQIKATCERCGHTVGIYPSGQEAIRRYPIIELVCDHCMSGLVAATLAPGAGPNEASESVPNPLRK